MPQTPQDRIEAYQEWLARQGKESSTTVYGCTVARYLEDPDGMEASIASRGFSPNYRRFLAACLKSWAVFCGDKKLTERISSIQLPAAVAKDHREPFDKETWIAIRQEIDSASYLAPGVREVCSIIAVRGIRCGDVLRVERDQIAKSLRTGMLSYEGKRERWQKYNAAPMRPYLESLHSLFEHTDYERVRQLVSKSGRQDSASRRIRYAFDRIASRLEMDPEEIYAHRFRHTYATHFLQLMEGDPEGIFKLQSQMSWARLETAANYLRRSRQGELDDIESRMLELQPEQSE